MPTKFRRLPETACPRCGSRDVRPARDRGLFEGILSIVGFQPARCHECAHRFLARPFGISKLRWAKCPRCYRMDLSTWDPKYYRIGGWTSFILSIGAHRWRCDACRCNFASFRPRQRKHVRPEHPSGVEDEE